MQKIQKTKIKKLIELLNSPLLKEGVHVLLCDENEVLIEYKGKVYTQDTIIVKWSEGIIEWKYSPFILLF